MAKKSVEYSNPKEVITKSSAISYNGLPLSNISGKKINDLFKSIDDEFGGISNSVTDLQSQIDIITSESLNNVYYINSIASEIVIDLDDPYLFYVIKDSRTGDCVISYTGTPVSDTGYINIDFYFDLENCEGITLFGIAIPVTIVNAKLLIRVVCKTDNTFQLIVLPDYESSQIVTAYSEHSFTNKNINGDNNILSNLKISQFKSGEILDSVPNTGSDSKIGNIKAIRDLVSTIGSNIKYGENVDCISMANIDLSAIREIDGFTLVLNSRVAVAGQTNPVLNGIYYFNGSSLVRASDALTGMDISKTIYHINYGDTYSNNKYWIAASPSIIGINNIVFSIFQLNWVAIENYIENYISICGSNSTKLKTISNFKINEDSELETPPIVTREGTHRFYDEIGNLRVEIFPGDSTNYSGIKFYNSDGVQIMMETGDGYLQFDSNVFIRNGQHDVAFSVNGFTGQTHPLIQAIQEANIVFTLLPTGRIGGFGITSPTASMHLPAGTINPGSQPIKINSGALLTTPEKGVFEYIDNGTDGHLYFTLNRSGVLTRVQII